MQLVLFLCIWSGVAVIPLENSGRFTHILSLSEYGNHFYVLNLDGLYLYDKHGTFEGQVLRKGNGPAEIMQPLLLSRSNEGVWVSSPRKAILVKGKTIVRRLKIPGLLCGTTSEDYFAFKKVSRHKKEDYLVMLDNKSKDYHRYLLSAPKSAKKNGYRFNNAFLTIDGEWIAFGEGFDNQCFLMNIKSDETYKLKPELKGMTLYSLKEHGTFPFRASPHVSISFLEKFDSFRAANNSFFFNYQGSKFLLVFWNVMSNKTARVQAFNMKGELVGVQAYEDGPHSSDDQGAFLFAKRPEMDDQNFLIIKRPMSELMGY